MKKIVIFTQNLEFGGIQKSVANLANYLSFYFDVNIILAENNKPIHYEIDKKVQLHSIKILCINHKISNIGEKLFKYRVGELEKLLSQNKPDLVISYSDYHNLILLRSNFTGKKILSCRNSIESSYKDKMIHLLSKDFYYDNIKKYYKKANKIIAVSNFVQYELRYKFNLDNVITIHNGIEEKETNDEVSYDKFILNVGRLHKQKGQRDLIYSFNKIKNKISQNLVIVGDGVEKENLTNLIHDLGLTSRVFLAGFDESLKYIKKCDLFIFPSYYEGFSNTILEVMSCKKNIISYEYSGSKEILPKENLVPLGNIEQLASKIVYYLSNNKENKKLESLLYKRSKKLSLNKALKKYMDVVKKTCAE